MRGPMRCNRIRRPPGAAGRSFYEEVDNGGIKRWNDINDPIADARYAEPLRKSATE